MLFIDEEDERRRFGWLLSALVRRDWVVIEGCLFDSYMTSKFVWNEYIEESVIVDQLVESGE